MSAQPVKKQYTFDYNGITVPYHCLGEGPPLVMLHGWGSRATVMIPVAEALKDIRTCYIPDLPGFGESAPPASPWSIDDYLDFCVAFVKNVIGEPVDMLAHSFGGRIVLKWCANPSWSSMLRHVVITGGAGMKPRRGFLFYVRTCSAKLLKAPFLILPNPLKEKALAWLRKTRMWKKLGSSEYRALDGVMRQTFVKTVSEYLEACLPEINHDVLLLWGKDDDATPIYQAERIERGLKKGALVTIDSAGHYAFLDQPARFNTIVRSYYKQ